MGGLLSSLALYPFFGRSMSGQNLNTAINPGWYRVDGQTYQNVPSGKFNYGLLVVFGYMTSYQRLIQVYISDYNEFCFRIGYGGSAGKSEINSDWYQVNPIKI